MGRVLIQKLCAILNGADEKATKELLDLMHLSNITINEINEYVKQVNR
jgi:hypothetical protein